MVNIARHTVSHVRSLGFALSVCTLPGIAAVASRLPGNMIEAGIGIHGEPGMQMTLPVNDNGVCGEVCDMITKLALDKILGTDATGSGARLVMQQGSEVALMINNLGGTSELEMAVVAKVVIEGIVQRGFSVARCYVGSFMTSLEMAGVSISIHHLCSENGSDWSSSYGSSALDLLDMTTTAPSWKKSHIVNYEKYQQDLTISAASASVISPPVPPLPDDDARVCPAVTIPLLKALCNAIIEIEPELTRYDAICGDGDCGMVMKQGAQCILGEIALYEAGSSDSRLSHHDCATICNTLGQLISESMGGTSGAVIEIMLRAMAANLAKHRHSQPASELYWVNALQAGLEAMIKYGGAQVGMRTMLDALVPAVAVWTESTSNSPVSVDVHSTSIACAEAAHIGMLSTKSMKAGAGRANYIMDGEKMEGIPDPGAYAVYAAFKAAASEL